MASNDDLMNFLKQMEEKREREKEEMAEARRKERQEDREEMIKLMEGCIGEKVGELIEPYKEKTEKFVTEKSNCDGCNCDLVHSKDDPAEITVYTNHS